MHWTPARKALVFAFGLFVLAALALGSAGRVSATQNHPTWTTGDFWEYRNTDGSTERDEILELSSLSLPKGTYAVWHLVATSTPAGGGTSSVQHAWFQDSNLGFAKGNFSLGAFGFVEVTADPPLPAAVFPLSPGNSWSGASTFAVVGTTFSLNLPYSGQVLSEADVTVPAGTFRAADVRNPSSGTAHSESYYSEAVGNFVRVDSYNGAGTQTNSRVLTSYRYNAAVLGFVFLIVGVLLVIAIIAAVAFMIVRRRRPMGPHPQYPGQYPGPYQQPPYQGPQQPPQQPPSQGPPGS